MKILAIGNSFSQDAFSHLHQAAAAQNIDLEAVTLYIGGCSLERHWLNVETNAADYAYLRNGTDTGRMVSIQETLDEGGWDVISLQQASHDSGWMDSYEPFMEQLVDYLRREAPESKLMLHETWAYEHEAPHKSFGRYHRSKQEMHERLHNCYFTMAEKYQLPIIPSGEVICALRRHAEFDVLRGGHSLCRDGFHMSLGYGRYALACTWLHALCGVPVSGNMYVPQTEEEVEERLLQIIRDTVDGM